MKIIRFFVALLLDAALWVWSKIARLMWGDG